MADFPEYSKSIEANLLASSEVAFENGISLLEEANILYEHDRFARATSLAILAEEELSKSFILRTSIMQKRWDQELYKSLSVHGHKQAISEALQILVPEMIGHLRRSKRTLVAFPGFPLQKRVHKIKDDVTKKQIKKQKIDKLKQKSQFVAIGRTGAATNTPSLISKETAAKTINRVTKFKAIVETQFGRSGDDHPLLRTESGYAYTSCVTTIKHISGLDIEMSIFDSPALSLRGKEMNPYVLLREFNTFEPSQLSLEQKKIFASLIVKYDGIGQMERQMQKLGLKSCQFLDDCKLLVAQYQDDEFEHQ